MHEAWTPLPANKVIHINWNKKIDPLKLYWTQSGDHDLYIDGAKSLARYWAMAAINAPNGHAECFLEWPLSH
ncbi:MAG: hypothetical protein KJO91_07790 [Gammaproteobacteria bacterium]|nr:hypothetical protein [Gammaproteobacteria bacterium]